MIRHGETAVRHFEGDVVEAVPKVPLVVLGGSDRRSGPVPRGAERLHFVVAYKGAEYRVGERSLAQLLVERARRSGVFEPVYLVGPERVYRSLVDCEIVDADGSLAENVRASVTKVQEIHGTESPVAFVACDVLAAAHELAELAAQMFSGTDEDDSPRGGAPQAALALPLIYGSQDLGASSWKPKYWFSPFPGAEPIPFLPGHLGIIRPSRLRMGLVYRLLQIAYDERNRTDYDRRTRRFVFRILGALLARDLFNILRLKRPTLTYNVLRHGLGTFFRWRRRALDLDGLALGLAGVFVRRSYFRRWGAKNVRLVTSPFVSLAKDIDTREELEELYRNLEASGRG